MFLLEPFFYNLDVFLCLCVCVCTFVVCTRKSSSWNERHSFPITKISPSVTEPHRNCQHPLTYVYCSTTKPLSICELHIVKVSNDHNVTIFNWLPPEYLSWRPAPPNASTVSPQNLPSLIITFRSPDTQIFFRTWGGEGGSLGRGVSIFPQKNSFKNPIFCIWVFIGMQM